MEKRSRAKPPKIGYQPDPKLASMQLSDLIEALNAKRIPLRWDKGPPGIRIVRLEYSQRQMELRRLVKAWMKSGPNLRKLFKQEPELEQKTKHRTTTFWPTDSGMGHLEWVESPYPIGETSQEVAKDAAFQDFMSLITNPEWELLGGPCPRCDDYFLKTIRGRKLYCSRKCLPPDPALNATRRARKQLHEAKIEIAQAAIKEWRKQKRRGKWEPWVAEKTGYTRRWLTRWVNKHELTPPPQT